MLTYDHAGSHQRSKTAFFISPVGLVLLGLLAIAGTYLWMEHRAHLLGALLWLPLLACPLMHLFMHHGHGGHGRRTGSDSSPGGGTPS
jgi:hypothetical protein